MNEESHGACGLDIWCLPHFQAQNYLLHTVAGILQNLTKLNNFGMLYPGPCLVDYPSQIRATIEDAVLR